MASLSKNIYINKLDDIVTKFNNIYQSTNKLKPLDVKQAHILILMNRIIRKILNLKLVIM